MHKYIINQFGYRVAASCLSLSVTHRCGECLGVNICATRTRLKYVYNEKSFALSILGARLSTAGAKRVWSCPASVHKCQEAPQRCGAIKRRQRVLSCVLSVGWIFYSSLAQWCRFFRPARSTLLAGEDTKICVSGFAHQIRFLVRPMSRESEVWTFGHVLNLFVSSRRMRQPNYIQVYKYTRIAIDIHLLQYFLAKTMSDGRAHRFFVCGVE